MPQILLQALMEGRLIAVSCWHLKKSSLAIKGRLSHSHTFYPDQPPSSHTYYPDQPQPYPVTDPPPSSDCQWCILMTWLSKESHLSQSHTFYTDSLHLVTVNDASHDQMMDAQNKAMSFLCSGCLVKVSANWKCIAAGNPLWLSRNNPSQYSCPLVSVGDFFQDPPQIPKSMNTQFP